ncbi:phycobiliprotein lyase [Pleurocapsa sp. PCC 7319]|uniref:phycobiliprotein lyase n=1 Tax=Pleurocapsa sp. PCC 7319 TaxID=118161 RepID=UPI00034DB9BF|nr:phycobiliprotein lyase [Pleurocapsa sp. PCC 7319]
MVFAETSNIVLQSLAVDFFRKSEGSWNSQRRYYSLNQDVEPQEVESYLTVSFLEQGASELIELAQSHQLADLEALVCGTKVTWESNYTNESRKPVTGSTVFGVLGNKLYRDRGFATSKPIIAVCSFTNADTMALRTEYNSNVFEEEVKLVGSKYRTRQTIISRAGQEITIGQYLEKRV